MFKNSLNISLINISLVMFSVTCFLSGARDEKKEVKVLRMPIKSTDIKMSKLKLKKNLIPSLIIGSGPAGLSAALYSSRLGIKTYVIEGNSPGGLLMKTTDVENWPGKLHILGPDLIKDLKTQAEHAGAQFIFDAVSSIDLSQWPFLVKTENDLELYALSIIFATGANPRLPTIEGFDAYWGRGITSCAVCDAAFYIDLDVVVIGGGDSAAEEAMQLARSKNITILVRKDKMRASKAIQERLKRYPNIHIMYNVEVKKILGDGKKLTGIKLFNNKTKKTTDMDVRGVFIAIGHDPNSDLLKAQVATNKEGYIQLSGRSQAVKRKSSQETIPGLFAAGDVEDPIYRQAGVASGSGIKAALDSYYFLTSAGYDTTIAQSIADRFPKLEEDSNNDQLIQEIESLSDFKEFLDSKDELILVDFYTPECSICLQMMPMIEQVIQDEKYAGKILLVKVDAQKAQDIAKHYEVYKVPTLLFFQGGNLIRKINMVTKSELNELVQQMINK